MKLKGELEKLLVSIGGQIPQETAAVMESSMKELKAAGIEKKALKMGDKVPAFELPNVHGEIISSENLLLQGPLVISFYRGHW